MAVDSFFRLYRCLKFPIYIRCARYHGSFHKIVRNRWRRLSRAENPLSNAMLSPHTTSYGVNSRCIITLRWLLFPREG